MPVGSEGVDRKSQTRDPSLTWEIPVEIDCKYHSHGYEKCWKAFMDASHEYRVKILRESLEKERANALSTAWASNLSGLAFKAVSFLSPSKLKAAGYKNPRTFVKIKRLILSKAEMVQEPTSFVVDGIVCRKNVTHKRMKPCIENPKILVLLGSLEYDKKQDKLSSFDEVIDLERNFLGRLISKIRSLNADLVVVQGGAARTAQELLLEAGISLVSAVKEQVLSRIADCIGARAVTLDGADVSCMGSCELFEVRAYHQHSSTDDPLSMMVFKGCRTGLASSIVLQGTDLEELTLLKKVARHATYIAYWHSIEARFLAEQFLATGLPLDASYKLIHDSLTTIQDKASTVSSISAYCSGPQNFLQGSEGTSEFLQCDEPLSDELLLSLSCRNPAKSVQCELPHFFAMPYYRNGDLALDDFLCAAVPFGKRCPHPDCGEGAALHLRSFLHEDGLVTLSSVHLASSDALAGDNQVWMWMRRVAINDQSSVRRIPMNGDAACISFAHLLTIIFNARDFIGEDIDFQSDFVRYFGLGRTVICLNYTKIIPYELRMPLSKLRIASADEFKWLLEEAKLLAEEGDEIFDLMEDEMKVKIMESAMSQDEWREAFSRARSCFTDVLKAIVPTRALMTETGDQVVLEAVQLINRLRRYLVDIARTWTAGLESMDEAKDVHVENVDERGPVHKTKASSESEGLNLLPELPTLMAPKLVDISLDSGHSSEDNSMQSDIIPAGLVAKYVSFFEDHESVPSEVAAERQTSTSRRPEAEATTIDLSQSQQDLQLQEFRSESLKHDELENKLANFTISMLHLHDLYKNQISLGGKSETKSNPADRTFVLKNALKGRLMPFTIDNPLVTVYDNEPTSILSYFLSTKQYGEFLQTAKSTCLEDLKKKREVQSLDLNRDGGYTEAAASWNDASVLRSDLRLDCQMFAEDQGKFHRTRFQMKAYFAPQFSALRQLCIEGGEKSFLASIGRCKPWLAQGGKSNVYFAKTLDERYIVKQMNRAEKQSFLEMAPEYLSYFSGILQPSNSEPRTCLAKILGAYQVSIENSGTSNLPAWGAGPLDFIVMENVFYGHGIDVIYDLKGSFRDRYAAPVHQYGPPVLLDENLRERNLLTPTIISAQSFQTLEACLQSDTSFLGSLGIMDYSLLVGFSRREGMLIVGLVDYLRQYTWDKQVESWVKASGLLGGAGKEPTIVSPNQYAQRFRQMVLSHLSSVPYRSSEHIHSISDPLIKKDN